MSSTKSNTTAGAGSSNDAKLAQQYQRKTDKQHILDNPDTYIGSIENVDSTMWVYDDSTNRIVLRDIEYIPGLYKLFDEGIVNCRDHVIRMIQSNNVEKKFVTYIDTTIGDDGTIVMSNDGNGIDIAKHPEYDVWIPEMIFGHLRTSTNYDKTEKKIVGGKNGFGFKLVLIWSECGKVETVDHIRGLKYVQEFKRNLDEICPPVITKVTGSAALKPYTRVTFKPDYKRLGIHGLTSDMLSLLKKRVYDIGAVTDHSIKKVKIGYNSNVIPVKNFQQYIDLYLGSKEESKRVYEQSDDRWEYAVGLSPTHEFIQVSFVNGICTFKGGKHIDYIIGQIVRKLCDYIEKKKKVKVNSAAIKEQLVLFLRCDIENPAFDSQTKDFMNTPSAKFGSTCTVSDNFIEKLAKMGVMDVACSLTEAKENKLAKKTDGSKTKTIRGIANFIDANNSGTNQSKDCILILCEGLSAMSGIVSGLSSNDRNTIGIYPLKGKLLNVRGEQVKKIAENKEISDLKKILGLETGKTYSTIHDVQQNLRYGKIMFMTDQDLDGSHIKGLCINLFHSEWASLVKIPGFLSFMNTPILRAKKGAQTKLFYNEGEYLKWKESFGPAGPTGWNIKYFKGLGTSTSAEFKEYFANKKIVDFVYTPTSDDTIDKIFNKKRTDDRKDWLEQYDKNSYLDTNQPNVLYEQFINQEMIHFSTYDCARSIPNMVDGLKISLRKILFSAFKRKLTSEIKVAQFSGYVSEHSAYHHGEASLNGAIVNMAQNFVGSNNINLLEPHGQFGCLSPDTPILLWDGTIKVAKDIVVGDKLVGDDGNERNVLKTTTGIDEMYEINDKYNKLVVNSQHILTLYFEKNGHIYWKPCDNTWVLYYFNGTTIKEKTIRVKRGDNINNIYNKSELSKEEAYDIILDFKNNLKIDFSKIIDIKLDDYLKLSKTNKRKLFMVSNLNNINWGKKSVPLDPYILGAWLGDGDHAGNGFTTIDDEIVKKFALWADTVNCEITHQRNSGRDDCYHYGIRRKNSGHLLSIGDERNSTEICPGCKDSKIVHPSCNWHFKKSEEVINCGIASNGMKRTDLNPFKEILKKHNLYKNKHIPFEYMVNDRETRMLLLAGFVDTDGCIKQNDTTPIIEISQSDRLHGNLIDQLNFIAKSLGFSTSITYSNTNGKTSKGFDKTMKNLRIFGDNIYEIPTLIKRKKINNLNNNRKIHNMNFTRFTIKPLGKGEFYGWQIDKNERFLLGNFIVTHNSRLAGGEDSASERYIFTQLNSLTRSLFPEADDAVLKYLDDDGSIVEPEYYVPIIPFSLINGISGIGTGFSCKIAPYNPKQLIEYLKLKLHKQSTDNIQFIPYYEGFRGTIRKLEEQKYLIKGLYKKIGEDKIQITELPVGTWTMPYTSFLESLMDGATVDKNGKKIPPSIKDFTSICTEVNVDFTVVFSKGKLDELEAAVDANGCNGVEKLLKLFTTFSNTNMHMFNSELKLHKYNSVEEIIDDFYGVRIKLYQKRKEYHIADMEHKLVKLSNRARYIQDNLSGTIDLRRKSAVQVTEMLTTMKYDSIDGDFKYMIKMPMDSVTQENVANIMKEKQETETELAVLKGTSVEKMWVRELETLEHEYDVYKVKRERIQSGGASKTAGGGTTDKKVKIFKKVSK